MRNQAPFFHGTSRYPLVRSIATLAIFLALIVLPALAVYRTAQETNLFLLLSGDAVTQSAEAPGGVRVTITSYPATASQ
jgi:hypothetical protein